MKTRIWMLGLIGAAILTGCPKPPSKPPAERQDAYDDSQPRKAAQNALEAFSAGKDTSSARLLGLKTHTDPHAAR